MKTKSGKVIKGMMFGGCSFTWGQGLNYYSNLDTNKLPPRLSYDKILLTDAHIKFIEANRFPRLVANHFGSYEFVKEQNGGSNLDVIDWTYTHFNQIEDIDKPNVLRFQGKNLRRIEPSEISHFIFQLTQPYRDVLDVTTADGTKHFSGNLLSFLYHKEYREALDNYLDKRGISYDEYLVEIEYESIQRVKRFFIDLENKGIKVILTTWPWENKKHIYQDEYLNSKLLKLHYKNQTYNSIHDLIGGDCRDWATNPELLIHTDTDSFENPPWDSHPSLLCHRVIADSIIKHIEENK